MYNYFPICRYFISEVTPNYQLTQQLILFWRFVLAGFGFIMAVYLGGYFFSNFDFSSNEYAVLAKQLYPRRGRAVVGSLITCMNMTVY